MDIIYIGLYDHQLTLEFIDINLFFSFFCHFLPFFVGGGFLQVRVTRPPFCWQHFTLLGDNPNCMTC